MSNSLRGKKISESFPRLVQVINGVFYDGTGKPLLTLNGATAGIGPQGIQGLRGPIGFNGDKGYQGFQGIDGAYAGRGFQGFQGPSPVYETVLTFQGVWDADTNTPSLSNATGASGDTYIVGAAGERNLGGGTVSYSLNDLIIYSESQWVKAGSASFGAQGAQGAQGLMGPSGSDGTQGAQGVQGPSEEGTQGFQGFQGYDGTQGFQGYQGNQGVQGPIPAFPSVLTLRGTWDAFQNVPPLNNSSGLTGDTWLVGVTGSRDLGSGTIQFNVNDLVVYVNSAWVNTGNATVGVQGVQGTQGVQGNDGFQGAQGPQGEIGTQGSQGFQGDFGLTGNQGAQGVQGSQGSQGIQGIQGVQGSQGSQGAQGRQGAQGAQGAQGLEGSQGTQGAQGIEGPQGFQGWQGPQGLQGVQGAQPIFPSVLTFQGIWNADTNTPTLVNGTGASGDTYIVGVTGTRNLGVGGATVTYNVNDLVVYAGGQWNKAGSATTGLQGSQGFQGVQGNEGFQGVQGVQGSQGNRGFQGAQGSQGVQGDTGATGEGVQGVQGSQGNEGFQGSQGAQGSQGSEGFQGSQGWQGWQGIPGPTGQSLSGVYVSDPIRGSGSTSSDPVSLIYNTDFTLTNTNTPGFLTGISLNLSATTIVSPSISSSSQIFKSDGVTPFSATIGGSLIGPNTTSNNFTVPNGCRVVYSGTASIPTAGAGQATPTAVSGAFIFTPNPPITFPAVGNTAPSSQLTANTSFSINISKPKTGLIVSGGQVVRASGNDTASASAAVNFNNVFYYGYLLVGPISAPIPQATVDLIGATSVGGDPLTQGIQNMTGLLYRFGGKAQSFAVNDGAYDPGYRVVFAYPVSLGDLSSLTVTGSSINQLGAFKRTTVAIVTLSGETTAYRVYVANANNSWSTTITTT